MGKLVPHNEMKNVIRYGTKQGFPVMLGLSGLQLPTQLRHMAPSMVKPVFNGAFLSRMPEEYSCSKESEKSEVCIYTLTLSQEKRRVDLRLSRQGKERCKDV